MSSCLRPAGAKPELEPIKDRDDFEQRMRHIVGKMRLFRDLQVDIASGRSAHHAAYADQKLTRLRAEMDQLVLMRAAQILEEAEQRRQTVMRKFAKPRTQFEVLENLAEMTLDDAERRGE